MTLPAAPAHAHPTSPHAPAPPTPQETTTPATPSLADVQREFPAYDCWRAISGVCYARPHHTPPGKPAPVSGDNPAALRDTITHHQTQQQAAHRDTIIEQTLTLIFSPAPTLDASPLHPVRSRDGTA
jgi:hypothetical protein